MKMKFDCAFLTRALIALLFVVAGFGKLMGALKPVDQMGAETTLTALAQNMLTPISFLSSTPLLAVITLILVIVIEIGVAIAYVIGWKKDTMGWILVAFTALTVIFYHNPFAGDGVNQMQMIQALKNIAIIGGIIATLSCVCGRCEVKK